MIIEMGFLSSTSHNMVWQFIKLVFPWAISIFIVLSIYYFAEIDVERRRIETTEARNIGIGKKVVAKDLESIGTDLIVLSQNTGFFDLRNSSAPHNERHLGEEFLIFSKSKRLYDQIRYLDEDGIEIVRVNFNQGRASLVPRDELQNKADRYYFRESISLNRGEIYVSPFDLNIEHGAVEVPYKPVIRLATPVFDNNERKIGVVILNYFGSRLLTNLKTNLANIIDHTMLINSDGYWLLNPDPSQEWGFMFDAGARFSTSYMHAWDEIDKTDSGQFYNDNGLFTYETIYPLREVGFENKVNEKKDLEGTVSAEYKWKLVSHVSQDKINAIASGLINKMLLIALPLYAIFLLGGAWVTYIRFRHSDIEQALLDSKQRMRATFERSIDAIITIDCNGRIVEFNPSAEVMFGCGFDDVCGQLITELIIPDDLGTQYQNGMDFLFNAGQSSGMGDRIRLAAKRKNGEEFPAELTLTPITVDDKSLVTAFIRDLSRQKKAEEGLKLREAALMAAANMVVITDTDGIVQWVNPAFTQCTGYSFEEIVGDSTKILNSGKQDKTFFQDMWDTIRAGEVWRGEFVNKRKDGSLYMDEATITPVKDDAGNIIQFIAIKQDITERKKAEDKLRENERHLADEVKRRERKAVEDEVMAELFQLALTSMPMTEYLELCIEIMVTSVPWFNMLPQGVVLLAQKDGSHDVLKFTASYNIDAEVKEHYATVAFGKCLCRQAAQNREIVFSDVVDNCDETANQNMPQYGNYNVPILEDDDVLGVLTIYLPEGHLRNLHEEIFLGRVADILSMGIYRRYSNLSLIKAKDDAEAGSRAKSAFLATMSHEIRTPMNGVLGMSELLIGTSLDAEQREFAETIISSARALLTIINDILDFSKIEAGKLDLTSVSFDLERAAHDVTQLMAPLAEDKGLELMLNYQPGSHRHFMADAGRIRQILVNLVGNALKFTSEGYVLINIECQQLSDEEMEVNISIQDTGIGIEQEKITELFQPFSQADESTTRKYGGTGLGLAVSKQLIELMGGAIGVNSTPGVGSTFWFTLNLPVIEAPEPIPEAELDGLRVLVVDDNPINRRLLGDQLEHLSMVVDLAVDANEAMVLAREAVAAGNPYRLFLLDHHMPITDGKELGKTILSDKDLSDSLLILLTSGGQRGDGEHFKEIGFAAYLTKPVHSETLRHTMAGVLGFKQEHHGKPIFLTSYQVPNPGWDAVGEDNSFDGRHIILAEDNVVNQKVAKTLLEKLGLKVTMVENGAKAVAQWERTGCDLILMDCQMPEIDGYDATALIRKLESGSDKHVPIIALTANAMETDRGRCLDAGMDDYISKPFRQGLLVSVLRRWLPTDHQGRISEDDDTESSTAQTQIELEADVDMPPTIDMAVYAGIRNLMGEGLAELIDAYLEDTAEFVRLMREACNSDDYAALQVPTHSMKSSSANIGAMRLSVLANQLEEQVRSDNLVDAEQQVLEIEEEFRRVSKQLSQ
jgi:PAS domain S-box-containing protein